MINVNKIVDRILSLDEGEGDVMLDANLCITYTKRGDIFDQMSFDRRNEFDSDDLYASYTDISEDELEDVVRDAVYTLAAA